MCDPGTHAIERPAFVISHSARKVVGGATPLVTYYYTGVQLLVHATINFLDVPPTFRIIVAKREMPDIATIARYGYIDLYMIS